MFIAHCIYNADGTHYTGSVHATLAEAKEAALELANSMLAGEGDSVKEVVSLNPKHNVCSYVATFYNVEHDYEDDVTVYVSEGNTFFGEA